MPRRVVVTRGGTGTGLAVARRFAADGDQVVIHGRRPDVLIRAAEQLVSETDAAVARVGSPLADFTTGQILQVSGGAALGHG